MKTKLLILCSLFVSLLCFASTTFAFDFDNPRVFTMSNEVEANRIIQYYHDPVYGLIKDRRDYPTRGMGSGGGLGNQGALVVNQDAKLLFAVNAGSDSISVFKIRKFGLKLIDVVSSEGSQPVSLTQHGNLLYVLNAGSDSIAGFDISLRGRLKYKAFSSRPLSTTGTGPAQISFSPRGDALVVTEKATNTISTYLINFDGLPGDALVNASAGATPFGFGFDRYGHLLVSEANGGAADASTVSSYEILSDGTLEVLDASIATTESAACWLVTSRDGRTAFTTNTASSTISSLTVLSDGELSLNDSDGVAANTGDGSAPIDMIFSSSGRFLYTLSARDGSINAYEIDDEKRLSQVSSASELPTSVNGLASF